MSPACKFTLIGCTLLLMIGCSGVRRTPPASPGMPQEKPVSTTPESPPIEAPTSEPLPTSPESAEVPREKPSYRALASLELSTHARILIEEGKLDEAIRTLERAVNLHPGSGESYYYLAEAWRLKGNPSQATEYNIMAAIRFQGEPEWMRRIDVQKQRIERLKKEP